MKELTYEQVEQVINRNDPLGLLAMGAPRDEYQSEIEVLLTRRNRGNSVLSWQEIRTVFEYWFYPGCISDETAMAIEQELR